MKNKASLRKSLRNYGRIIHIFIERLKYTPLRIQMCIHTLLRINFFTSKKIAEEMRPESTGDKNQEATKK